MLVNIGPYVDNEDEERVVEITIHNYDSWNADSTLALIIHPILLQLQETKHGSPYVDDEDVPIELRSTSAPPKENEWDTDDFHHDRWDWVLNEMIWAFHQKTIDYEEPFYTDSGFKEEEFKEHYERMTNGFRLFGKYYTGLWD